MVTEERRPRVSALNICLLGKHKLIILQVLSYIPGYYTLIKHGIRYKTVMSEPI